MAFKMSSVCFAEAVALGFFADSASADFCFSCANVLDGREKREDRSNPEAGATGWWALSGGAWGAFTGRARANRARTVGASTSRRAHGRGCPSRQPDAGRFRIERLRRDAKLRDDRVSRATMAFRRDALLRKTARSPATRRTLVLFGMRASFVVVICGW
jgi:hypothetical protein